MIKAIDTVFDGNRFRSRLEARWATFFKTLGIRYEYEKEGYDLGEAGWYLPDFWLPEQKSWIEVKPYIEDIKELKSAIQKCGALAHMQGNSVLMLTGEPYYERHLIYLWLFAQRGYGAFYGTAPIDFEECEYCHTLLMGAPEAGISFSWKPDSQLCSEDGGWHKGNREGARLLQAYAAARQARF
jgi:hypothetical protein